LQRAQGKLGAAGFCVHYCLRYDLLLRVKRSGMKMQQPAGGTGKALLVLLLGRQE
jgi:hypothetical protein